MRTIGDYPLLFILHKLYGYKIKGHTSSIHSIKGIVKYYEKKGYDAKKIEKVIETIKIENWIIIKEDKFILTQKGLENYLVLYQVYNAENQGRHLQEQIKLSEEEGKKTKRIKILTGYLLFLTVILTVLTVIIALHDVPEIIKIFKSPPTQLNVPR